MTIGLLNLSASWYIVGKYPESYWISMIFKGLFYLGIKWESHFNEKRKEIFYMTEFCWIACHTMLFYMICALLAAIGVESLNQYTTSRYLFLAYWGIANGPLAIATILLNNAIVLHDIPNLASCFIHLTPSSTTWTMRWWSKQIMAKWPGVFDLPDPDNITESFTDIFYPAATFYLVWMIGYFVFFLMVGRYCGHPKSKYDTLYFYTMRTNKLAVKLCGYKP